MSVLLSVVTSQYWFVISNLLVHFFIKLALIFSFSFFFSSLDCFSIITWVSTLLRHGTLKTLRKHHSKKDWIIGWQIPS